MINNLILKDCCSFQEGYVNPSQKIPTYFGNDIKWLRASDLSEGYVYDTERKLSKKGFESAGKSAKMFPKDSIAISKSGTIGSLGILKDEMCGNRAVINIVVNPDKANLKYIFYTLKYKKAEIVSRAGGSIQKNLYVSALETLILNHNSIKEQSEISSVLSALDKKIELNNQINAELEAMAKTLYDYWFVQFDFPDADGKPYKSSGGKMVYNEVLKREIPEGWKDSTIEGIESNIVTGKTPSKKKPEYFNGDVPFITIGDIRANTFIVQTEETLTSKGADTQKNKYLPENTICVTCIASPGLVGFVTEQSQTNQQINSVVCSNPLNMYYLYFAIKAYFEGAKAKTGNTFANMNKGDFSSINMLYPNKKLLSKYYEVVNPLFRQIKAKTLENKELENLRDWLLPMLMNGQVTVK
ncbi:restriction endonuclease subunit S [uncultured Psychrobacter sp.]|uniref:restriction endonuclease subunit S n=1 Tax=uncultured Psychrobacter sp. TaxID=259303 RepID=UPI0026192D6D|nr:restriction endonuclease subunit S [uncultured Psychrobacter sp.]